MPSLNESLAQILAVLWLGILIAGAVIAGMGISIPAGAALIVADIVLPLGGYLLFLRSRRWVENSSMGA